LVLAGDGALLDRATRELVRVAELLVDEALDEPVLAQQRGHRGERVLHALTRLGALGHRSVDAVGHVGNSKCGWALRKSSSTLRQIGGRHPREDDADLAVQSGRALVVLVEAW